MGWLTSIFAFFLFFKRKKTAKNGRPQKETNGRGKRKNGGIISHYELIDTLKENIGQEVTIKVKKVSHLYENQVTDPRNEFTGRVLAVDDEWIKLELKPSALTYDRNPDYLYFRTETILEITVDETKD